MCSIHNVRRLAVVFALGLGALGGGLIGCQRVVPSPSISPVNNTPIVVDPAMQHRDWDRSTSYYQNGATVAGGTSFMWQTHETVPGNWRPVTDIPVAGANIISEPVGIFVESPFGKQVYRGEAVPPTYTANPPVPQ